MFVRVTRVKRDGKSYEYAQLVQSYRRESDNMPQHRVIASLGELSALEVENLKATLAASKAGRRVVVARAKRSKRVAPKPQANLRYLDIAVAFELWREWGLDKILRDIMPSGESDIPASQIVEVLAVQRLVSPDSKLAAVRWLPRTALPQLLGMTPEQFNNTRIHRVLGQLEAATPTLMAKLPKLYQERSGAFVSMFMDVTDAWFVGHGPKAAVHAKTKEGLITRKIGIVLLCNELGYPLRWEVIAGNCNDNVAMTEMLQAVSGLNWVGAAPIVLDRAMGTTTSLCTLASTELRFLTALIRPEFSKYAPALPWRATQGLSVVKGDSVEAVAEAAERVEAAGMQRVNDSLFVADYGVIKPIGVDADVTNSDTPMQPNEDRTIWAMRVGRQIGQAVIDGRYSSYNAAGAALGLKPGTFKKYRELTKLADAIQQEILDGKAAGRSLADLVRIARIEDTEAQHAAFQTLLASAPARRLAATPTHPTPKADTDKAKANSLRVRVITYFNPKQFVEQRQRANARLENVQAFVAELNRKLASPRSKRNAEKILATVDRRLRRDNLIEVFKVTVNPQNIAGRIQHEVEVELDEEVWARRRRYDGFSVLIGHPELPHTAEQLCRLYREKDTVEKDFQVIKSVLEVRPIRHRNDQKVKAHVTLCMLALLLERILREKLKGNYTTGEALELLEPCRLNRYRTDSDPDVYTITEIDKNQRAILRKLRLQHLADDDHLAARLHPL